MPHSGSALQLQSALKTLFWLENVILWGSVAFCFYSRSTGSSAQCGDSGAEPSVTHSAFLVLLPLQDQRDSLFFHPCIYSGRNHSPFPFILLPLKTLCKVSSIRLGFYKRLEELLSYSSSCFPLLSLQLSFVSYGLLFQKSRKLSLVGNLPVPFSLLLCFSFFK